MQDILKEIVTHKKTEIARQKEILSFSALLDESAAPRSFRSMRKALENSESGIIAEFKRRSPSKGWISQNATIETILPAYEKAGASAISVLTNEKYFGGSLRDLRCARQHTVLPILRKEFIIDSYQLLQARIVGADAVLLIAACLDIRQCEELAAYAHELGLEVLLEVHCEEEMRYLNNHIDMLGINNRNLGTFVTDVQNSFRLARQIKEHAAASSRPPLLISESGISHPETVALLRKEDFRGFLIGETFMKTPDPGATLADFIRHIHLATARS